MSNLTSDLEHLRASNRELETNIVEYQVKLNGYTGPTYITCIYL